MPKKNSNPTVSLSNAFVKIKHASCRPREIKKRNGVKEISYDYKILIEPIEGSVHTSMEVIAFHRNKIEDTTDFKRIESMISEKWKETKEEFDLISVEVKGIRPHNPGYTRDDWCYYNVQMTIKLKYGSLHTMSSKFEYNYVWFELLHVADKPRFERHYTRYAHGIKDSAITMAEITMEEIIR